MLQLVPVAHLGGDAMSELDELHAAFLHAGGAGALEAGHAAIMAGARHLDSPVQSFLAAEKITTEVNGSLNGQVSAAADAIDSPRGPQLASSSSTADAMATAAADEGLRQVFG